MQQAQGSAKPVHLWPGESALDMAKRFDAILERAVRAARLGADAPVGS